MAEEALLAVLASLPDRQAQRLLDAVCCVPLDGLLDEPTFVLGDGDTLTSLLTGTGRLRLDLDQEQRAGLDQIRNRPGPYIVTGGPGTGKTVVALYAVEALLQRLRADGVSDPRVLYVTYTRTLTATAERILQESLQSRDWLATSVMTLDQLVQRLWGSDQSQLPSGETLRSLIRQARSDAFNRRLSPDPEEDRRLARSRRSLINLYLLEKIEELISGRGLRRSIEEYLAADRSGWRLPLNETQRRAIGRVYEMLCDLLLREEMSLIEQRRQHVLDILRMDGDAERYDAVVADEVQDFDLVGVRLLAELCLDRRNLVLVGDVHQSLYQRTFRWKHVEEEVGEVVQLKLPTGHRCPPEIHDAAKAYLRYLPDSEIDEASLRRHRNPAGKTKPVLVLVEDWEAQSPLPNDSTSTLPAWSSVLVEVLREQRERLKVLTGRCPVLAPTNPYTAEVSTALHLHNERNELIHHGQLVTNANVVKVLTWHNGKGFEFDVVVVLLPDWQPPPVGWNDVSLEEMRESVEHWRRAAYVAMTRAALSPLSCDRLGAHRLSFMDSLTSCGMCVIGHLDRRVR